MSNSVALLIISLLFVPAFARGSSPTQQKTTAWYCVIMRCPLIIPVMPPWNISPQPTSWWYQPPTWYPPPVLYQPPVPPNVEPAPLPVIQRPLPPSPPPPHESHHHSQIRHRHPPPRPHHHSHNHRQYPPPSPPQLHHHLQNNRQHPQQLPRLRTVTQNPQRHTGNCCQPPPQPTTTNPPLSSPSPAVAPPLIPDCSTALIKVDGCIREVIESFAGSEIRIGRECCLVISTLSHECFDKALMLQFSDTVFRSKATAFCSAVHNSYP